MRVGIVAWMHESNTFIAGATTLAHFEEDLLVEGEEVRLRLADAHHEVGGFFHGLAEANIDAVPVFAARALPYGTVQAAAYSEILRRLETALDRAGPLDGLLVAPHGAMVSEAHPDGDGHWLSRMRERFGPTCPIIGTLDLHVNLSPSMVAACDALLGYRTNPHLDQKQRGLDAARLMARTLRGEVRPTMAGAFPPLAVNIERQLTAQAPCKPLYEQADAMLRQPGVLSNSVLLGFPYADVAEMGSAAIVVADSDPNLAQRLVNELASSWWDRRREFIGRMIGVAQAVDQAAQLEGPVCLLDMGDNVGGGAPGDGTEIAHELHRRAIGPSFVCLADAESAQQARNSGVGAKLRLRIGGKTDKLHGSPLDVEATVRGLYDGRFEETQPRHGGWTKFDQGPTAVVETATGLTIMLTTRRMVPFSLRQVSTFDLDPARFRVLVAKGVHAPVAAYAPVCKHLLRVDTPGVTCADMTRLVYHHRRRPLFPFEVDTTWGQ
ncbi:MAG: M81 family metallopeptidase [Gemmataceae bacterium]|nr:M81 family metallopeptidase [Gemmataceae bacterium]